MFQNRNLVSFDHYIFEVISKMTPVELKLFCLMFGLTEHAVIMNKQMKIPSGIHLSTSRKSILIIAPDVVAFIQDTWLGKPSLAKTSRDFS